MTDSVEKAGVKVGWPTFKKSAGHFKKMLDEDKNPAYLRPPKRGTPC